MSIQVYYPTNHEKSSSPTLPPVFSIIYFPDKSQAEYGKMVSQSNFNLHFSDGTAYYAE